MCGICGSLRFDGGGDPALVSRMVDVLRHRGPDDEGVYHDREVTLGHTRLSIIDVAGGHQPMANEDESVWLTFNGEIFNYAELREELIAKGHRFRTRSDTEVILHLYEQEGESCVERFNGQWAFALWDRRQKKLFLSRDRLGVRPLFYTQVAGQFLFASEVKSLLECPDVMREIDLQSLDQIFTFWTIVPPRTALKNIWQLPPGYSMTVKDGCVRSWPYWQLNFPASMDEVANGTEKRLTEELADLLLDATRIRLRSDVPVGAYLSGGLDSTFVTSLAKRLAGNRLRSFSVSFEDTDFDESGYQRESSAFLATEHSDVHCSYEDIASAFPDVIWHTEQPILRTAPAPLFFLSHHVHNCGFKVVLTGEGADETMGGYDIFKELKIRRFWQKNPNSSWRPLLLKRLYPYMGGIQQQPVEYLKRFFHVTADDPGPFFSHLPRWELTARAKLFFSRAVKSDLGLYDSVDELRRDLPEAYFSWDSFRQAQFLEMKYLLPGYILSSQGDRVAMAHSVEGRFPFLDRRVVEFASRLPMRLKMKVLREKHLLKLAAERAVPSAVRNRTKQPFRAPDGPCFTAAGAPNYVDEMLSPDCLRRYGVFEPDPVTKLLQKFRSGQAIGTKDNMAFVGVLSTQLFIGQFIDQYTRRTFPYAGSGRVAAVCNREFPVRSGW